MPTFTIELYKSKTLSDGRHPVCIRVTHNGERKRKAIASAFENEWDPDHKPYARIRPRSRNDYTKVNKIIDEEIDKYEANFKKLKNSTRSWKAEDVFELQAEQSTLFKDLSNEYISMSKSFSTATCYSSFHNKILRYVNGKDFYIEDINSRWVEGLIKFCRKDLIEKKGKIPSENGIIQIIDYLKRVSKRAKVDLTEIIDQTSLTYVEQTKDKLTQDELIKIASLKYADGSSLLLAQHTFILQFFLRGIRIRDVLMLKPSNIQSGNLKYKAHKTKKEFPMKIIDPALDILNLYLDSNRDYILPWIKLKPEQETTDLFDKHIRSITSMVNKLLKKIGQDAGIQKTVSTHIARHSFASVADAESKGDIALIQEMFGHSSRSITEKYVKSLRKTDQLNTAADQIYLKFKVNKSGTEESK